MGDVVTGIQLAKEAYKSRGLIKPLWEQVINKWKGKKSTIVFTGVAGAGKTVLFDCLSGKIYQEGYTLPGRSTKVEMSTKVVPKDSLREEPKKRLAYVVVPGQASTQRIAFVDVFNGKTEIAGVIHVVSNGLPTIREKKAEQVIREGGAKDIETYQRYQQEAEIKDLAETCDAIERYMMATGKRLWMIVALTKIDLFHQSLEENSMFYANENGSFAKELQALQNRVGSNNFQWEIMPVSSWLEDFVYGEERLHSQLESKRQREYVESFLKRLIQYC